MKFHKRITIIPGTGLYERTRLDAPSSRSSGHRGRTPGPARTGSPGTEGSPGSMERGGSGLSGDASIRDFTGDQLVKGLSLEFRVTGDGTVGTFLPDGKEILEVHHRTPVPRSGEDFAAGHAFASAPAVSPPPVPLPCGSIRRLRRISSHTGRYASARGEGRQRGIAELLKSLRPESVGLTETDAEGGAMVGVRRVGRRIEAQVILRDLHRLPRRGDERGDGSTLVGDADNREEEAIVCDCHDPDRLDAAVEACAGGDAHASHPTSQPGGTPEIPSFVRHRASPAGLYVGRRDGKPPCARPDPRHLRSVLETALPPEVADSLNLETVQIEPGTWIDRHEQEHLSDLAASCRRKISAVKLNQ
jgi:hypothetical protein